MSRSNILKICLYGAKCKTLFTIFDCSGSYFAQCLMITNVFDCQYDIEAKD